MHLTAKLWPMKDAFDFSGKVALVTGSSRGIGAGIIAAFGQLGARCVVNYVADAAGRNKADADQVAAALGNARVMQCDVGDPEQVRAMMEQAYQELGGLDILVNNAGVLQDRTIKKMKLEEWESVLQVNLTGAFNCIQHATPILRSGGRIVNIASVSGQLGFFGQANYSGRSMPEEVADKFLAQVPAGRCGKVDEVVFPVLFLCSSYAGYITGQVIHVSGGFYMG